MTSRITAVAVFLLFFLAVPHRALTQTLEDFGHGRMTVGGTPALGARPLLVILVKFDPLPQYALPTLAHDRDYYDQLVFNYFRVDGNGTPLPSANGYFLENSQGRFFWTRAGAGTYGPYVYNTASYDPETPGDSQLAHFNLALQSVADEGFDFAQYDANGDGTVGRDELSVLVVDNIAALGGNRGTDPACFTPSGQSVQLCLQVANVGERTSLMLLAHELSHQLGTIELYGTGFGENQSATLMAASPYDDDMTSFHLDPWHKMLLGWVEPRIYSLDVDGGTEIDAASVVNGNSPVILYSASRGVLEFFILEFRAGAYNGGGYDRDVVRAPGEDPISGLMVWHVKTKGLGGEDVNSDVDVIASTTPGESMVTVFMNGWRSFTRGRGGVWPAGAASAFGAIANPDAGVIPYPLNWLNEVSGNVYLRAAYVSDGGKTMHVAWRHVVSQPPIQHRVFAYSSQYLSGATGFINDADASFTTQQGYGAGSFGYWTHVVSGGVDVIFYDSRTGNAAIGQVDVNGHFITTRNFWPGYFAAGWTHVVVHKGYVFFYNKNTGAAAAGQFQSGWFRTYRTWTNFARGWTAIVSTANGLLFYNGSTGAGAVGDWSYVRANDQFGSIIGIGFVTLTSYGAGSFATLWSRIVPTTNGILFYSETSGDSVVADVNPDGTVTTQAGSARFIGFSWTSIVADGAEVLLYNRYSGDVAVGTVNGFDPWRDLFRVDGADTYGGLSIRATRNGYFSPGWTNLLTTVVP